MPQPQRKRKKPAKVEKATHEASAFSAWRDRLWIALIVLGILLRFAVSAVSTGTNDAAAWLRFGDEINHNGLLTTYGSDPDFNHPPLPGYWAAICSKIAGNDDVPLHDLIFTFTFKLAPILGDCLGIYLLYRIFRERRDRTYGLFIAAMFALSIDAIAVSGYHCNTDSLLIALCLLSLYLFRTRPLLAGIALAAAINIKIIPVLLVPVLLLQLQSRRQATRFILGLAAGVIPFIPPLIATRAAFVSNALQYNSMLDRWGLNYFLISSARGFNPSHAGDKLSAAYYNKGRYLILALIGLWAVVTRWKPRWNVYEAALIPFAIFLILAPGFGVQYTVLIGLLLFAARPAWAIAYGLLAGVFIGSAYVSNLRPGFPLYSQWHELFPDHVALLGIATWMMLVLVSTVIIARPMPLDEESSLVM